MAHTEPPVTVRNNQIFLKFKAALQQGDVADFLDTTQQLLRWLRSDKAYYAAARPEIIDMIEIAQTAIIRIHGRDTSAPSFHVSQFAQSDLQPMISTYVQMVEVVCRYRYLFLESSLQARIQLLQRSIVPVPVVSSSQVVTTTPRLDPYLSGPTLATSPPPSSPDAPSPHFSAQTQPTNSAVISLPSSMPLPYVAPHVLNAPSVSPVNESASAPPVLKPKRAKPRRSVNLGFLNGDLEWFAEQQTGQKATVTATEAEATTARSVDTLETQRSYLETAATTASILEISAASASANAPDVQQSVLTSSTTPVVLLGDGVHRSSSAMRPTSVELAVNGLADSPIEDMSNEVNLAPAALIRGRNDTEPVTVPDAVTSSAIILSPTNSPHASVPLDKLLPPGSLVHSPAFILAEGESIREESPDIPLVQTVQLSTEIRRAFTAQSSPVAAAPTHLPDPQTPASFNLPDKPTSLKKKKGRPPGVRTLPVLPSNTTLVTDSPVTPRKESLPTSKDAPRHPISRKRSRSAVADEQAMPPQQRKRTAETLLDGQTPALVAVAPVYPTITTPLPLPDVVPETGSPVATSSGPQSVVFVHDALVTTAQNDKMDVSFEHASTSQQPSSRLKPTLSLLSLDSKEEGEISEVDTPIVESSILPTPPVGGEIHTVTAESYHPAPPHNASIPHVLPPTDENVHSVSSEIAEASDATPQTTPGSPPTLSSGVSVSSERIPLGTSLRNVAQQTQSVYGVYLEIMGIAWAYDQPNTSALDITLNQDDIAQLSRWMNRKNSADDVSDSRCMSLVPYRFNELSDIYSKSGDITPQELLNIKPIPWQDDYDLWVQVNDGKKIALCSPQLSYEPNENHLVDITTHVKNVGGTLNFKEGSNSVNIIQHGGLLNVAWVLALHSPSPSQLRFLQKWRDAESDWRAFVARVKTFSPLPISFPPTIL